MRAASAPARGSRSADRAVFVAAVPEFVDGGARVFGVGDFRPADAEGPACAVVMTDWGSDDRSDDGRVLHRWGTHVMTYEPDLGRYLLWQARYHPTFEQGWADLCLRVL